MALQDLGRRETCEINRAETVSEALKPEGWKSQYAIGHTKPQGLARDQNLVSTIVSELPQTLA
jgi:hypothetical protein